MIWSQAKMQNENDKNLTILNNVPDKNLPKKNSHNKISQKKFPKKILPKKIQENLGKNGPNGPHCTIWNQ